MTQSVSEQMEQMELMNDLRRTADAVCKTFKDCVDHYEYTGSMNNVEDLRDAVRRAREYWMAKVMK